MHVVATAGHVDHGKSTLVRALTGIEPDRWAEEHRRGLTIDLGYAWTTLPSGDDLAFVDVPGHERFIGNMLAGLGPAPAVLLVVAADEGWRAQTAEHLAAVDALGLTHGLLVVTRSDLSDPGPALAEARDRVRGSSLAGSPAVAVSARTGDGLDALRSALERLVAELPAPRPDRRLRLWVDRSFTIRGAGTVVTGTLGEGTIAAGDDLVLHDHTGSVRRVTVRGLQSLERRRRRGASRGTGGGQPAWRAPRRGGARGPPAAAWRVGDDSADRRPAHLEPAGTHCSRRAFALLAPARTRHGACGHLCRGGSRPPARWSGPAAHAAVTLAARGR